MVNKPRATGFTPFWKAKRLDEMSRSEWESLCDGCGLCCLLKLEDEDDGAIAFTNVVCALLDSDICRCTDYENRRVRIPTCVQLTPDNIETIRWMPQTCAYRLVAEGADLYWWHHLISEDPETVHKAGVSVRGKVVSENDVCAGEIEDYIIGWLDEEEAEAFQLREPDRPVAR